MAQRFLLLFQFLSPLCISDFGPVLLCITRHRILIIPFNIIQLIVLFRSTIVWNMIFHGSVTAFQSIFTIDLKHSTNWLGIFKTIFGSKSKQKANGDLVENKTINVWVGWLSLQWHSNCLCFRSIKCWWCQTIYSYVFCVWKNEAVGNDVIYTYFPFACARGQSER